MDISIGTTIIAGIFVVSAPVVSYFVKRYFDGKDKTQVESTRRDALAGRWEGIMTLDCTDNNISGDISIKCEITEKDNTLEGKSVIAYRYLSQEITSNLDFKCDFYYEQLLTIQYRNSSYSTIQLGSCLLLLSSTPDKLSGKFIGYGYHYKDNDVTGIAAGGIKMKKVTVD